MLKSHLLFPALVDVVEKLATSNQFIRENYLERLRENQKFIEETLAKYGDSKDKAPFFKKK
jgi:hypothetical protein